METWVLVDDSDVGIKYTGPWKWTSSAIDSLGAVIGYDNTAHAVVNTTSPASFTYTFEGTKLAIYGIAATFDRTIQVSGTSIPEWECIIDNTTTLTNNDPFGVFPWHSYCETDVLSPGQHTVEFRVTDTGIGLWFDALRYLPSQTDTSHTNVTVWIDSTDTRLGYRDDWQAIGTAYMTTAESMPDLMTTPALSMNYNGSSVAWYALSKAAVEKARPDLPALALGNTTTTSGFYRIDNGPTTPFAVDLSQQPVEPELNPYNTPLFQTHPTVPGPHTLTVFYDGNSTMWPLTLDYLAVENSLIWAPGSGSSGGGTGSGGTKARLPVIAGAVCGIVGGLFVLFIGLLVLRKYRLKQQKRYRQTRMLQLAKSDIKLRPFTRMAEPVEKTAQPTRQYPFSADNEQDPVQA